MARAAHALSLANPYISADVIEVEEFPDLARQYQVMGVPKTVINDKLAFMGDLPDEASAAQTKRRRRDRAPRASDTSVPDARTA